MRRTFMMLACAALILGLVTGCEKRGEITGTEGRDSGPDGTSGPPDSLAIPRDFPTLLADGVDATTVHARVMDAEGRGLAGVGVRFSSTHGTIEPFAVTGAEGEAEAILASEASTDDLTAVVRAELRVEGQRGLSPRGAMLLLTRIPVDRPTLARSLGASTREGPGASPLGLWPASLQDEVQVPMLGVTLTVRADPGTIPADGVSTSRIVATLMETTRRVPIAGREVLFGATAGSITGKVQTGLNGSAAAVLTSAQEAGESMITVYYGRSLSVGTSVSFSPLALRLESESPALIADGSSSTRVIAYLANEQGNPASGARIEFTTTIGSISSPVETGLDGKAITTLVAGRETGTAEITARFGGSVGGTIEVLFVAPPATAELLLHIEPASMPADGASEAELTATALDTDSNLMPDGTAVVFVVASGDGRIIGPVAVTQQGVARSTFVSGTMAGEVVIGATSGPAQSTAALLLTPLAGSRLDLSADNAALLADGLSSTGIAATVTDNFGHPVAMGTHVEFATTLGALEAIQPTDENGIATAVLRSERFVTGIARVSATVGEIVKTVDVDFTSEGADHVEAVRVDPPRIGVLGSGDRENATITFEVRDRNGIPIDAGHAVQLSFEVVPMDGATDATVHPLVADTNDRGRAAVTVNAGNLSGIVAVRASSGSVSSRSVRIAIHGGLLDPEHFTIFFERINVAGLVYDGILTWVTGKLGDVHGNPVPDSTAVWFAADYGIVQGSAFTDAVGDATLLAQTGRPRPLIPGGDGLVRICAHSINRFGQPDSICGHMLWSGPTIVEITDPPSGFTVSNGGSIGITYRVHDANDNPLTGGTSIVVRTTGGKLGGAINVVLPDTQSWEYTNFYVTLSDEDVEQDIPADVTVTVSVTSQNGNRQASISGTMN